MALQVMTTIPRSEAFLQKAMQAAKVGLWDWDLRSNVVTCSDEWKLQLGYGKNEILDDLNEWESRVHPDDLPKIRQKLAEYRMHPWPDFEEEFRIQHKDGSWRWMLSRGGLVMDEKGQPASMAGCHVDITRHKLIEISLQESRRKLEEAQRIAHVGHWERDLRTDFITWSGETCRIFGLSSEGLQMSFQEFLKRVHPDDRARVAHFLENAIGKLQRYSVEYKVQRTDGEEQFVHSEGEVVRDSSGQALRAFGTLQDITGRIKAENALRQSENKLRLVIDTMPAMAWIVLPTGAIEFLNRRWLDYSGLSLEEAIKDPTGTMHPEDIPRVMKKWSRDMAAGESYEDEMRLRRADGEYRWFLVRTAPLFDEQGHILKWYGTSTDIEDRKRAEEALQETQALLARVARVSIVGELTASIAHEVNQPLGGIVTNAEAALNWLSGHSPDLTEAREALQRIISDATRASEVIARIRSLLKSGKSIKTRFGLDEIIEEIVALIKTEAQRRHVTVQTQLEPNLPEINADRVQIQQVLMNLVMNSLDALSTVEDRPRVLTIQAYTGSADFVRIAVQDTGIGIDPQRLKDIFDPFHTTKPHGLGLGLSISRSIIDAHGGHLVVIRNDGPGVTFQLTLPMNHNSTT